MRHLKLYKLSYMFLVRFNLCIILIRLTLFALFLCYAHILLLHTLHTRRLINTRTRTHNYGRDKKVNRDSFWELIFTHGWSSLIHVLFFFRKPGVYFGGNVVGTCKNDFKWVKFGLTLKFWCLIRIMSQIDFQNSQSCVNR